MNEWQPIETALKDGTPVLVYCPPSASFQIVASYKRQEDGWEGWIDIYEGEDIFPPSHWMPLPEPPSAGE